MESFLIMTRNVILFAALAIPGYLLVRCKILKHEQSVVLSNLLMYVGMPFLILSGTVSNLSFNKELFLQLLAVALIGIACTLSFFILSKPFSSMEKESKAQGMMRFCSVFSNNGFLGIPLAVAVFEKDSAILTVLVILNIITNVLMYTFGTYLVSGDSRRLNLKKALLNPVLIAFFIGILLNLLNVKRYIPEIVTYSDHFSGLVTSLSMTIIGMKLATVRLPSLFTAYKNYYVSLIKLVVFPALTIALLLACRAILGSMISNDIIIGFFIAFAMPTAGLASTFADNLDGDTKNAVAFTLCSTLFSIITIPLLFWALISII